MAQRLCSTSSLQPRLGSRGLCRIAKGSLCVLQLLLCYEGFAEAGPAGLFKFELSRKKPVLLGELEKAQMSLFHTGYSWYIPSSSQQARLLCRLLPKVGSILSSLLEGFQQGVNIVL